jgi:hypothetical protein
MLPLVRRLRLLAVPLLVAPAAVVVGPASGAEQDVVVSAHRGGAAYAPENTMPAFRNAVRLGVDELEADVQLTADGELVLLHDDTLDRTTDCTGAVVERTWAEVARCDAAHWWTPGPSSTVRDVDAEHPLRGTGVGVPRLAELLALVAEPGAPRASIELKNIPGEANFDPLGTVVATAFVAAVRDSGVRGAGAGAVVLPDQPRGGPPAGAGARDAVPHHEHHRADGRPEPRLRRRPRPRRRGARPHRPRPHGRAGRRRARRGKVVVPYTPNSASSMQAALDKGRGRHHHRPPGLPAPAARPPVPDRLAVAGEVDACERERTTPGPVDRPAPETCEALRPPRWAPTIGAPDPRGDLRVVGLQYKQDVDNVQTYDTFRTAMRCLVEDHVVPLQQPGKPMLVVFPETIGLMTIATGRRGALVREQAATPLRAPVGDSVPVGAATALGLLNAAYAPQTAAYQAMLGPVDPRKQVLLAATDTFARAFSHTFSDIARDYGSTSSPQQRHVALPGEHRPDRGQAVRPTPTCPASPRPTSRPMRAWPTRRSCGTAGRRPRGAARRAQPAST